MSIDIMTPFENIKPQDYDQVVTDLQALVKLMDAVACAADVYAFGDLDFSMESYEELKEAMNKLKAVRCLQKMVEEQPCYCGQKLRGLETS